MHKMLRENSTLIDVSDNLGMLGALVGGNHLSAKEIEDTLKQWQRDVYEIAVKFREYSQGNDECVKTKTGLTDKDMENYRANRRRKRNA